MERFGRSRVGKGVRLFKGLLVAVTVVLAALGADARAVSPALVDIRDSKYLPPTVTVAVGTTVRWTNRDEETHTVTSGTGLFGSAGLELGEDYTYTFATRGEYPYTCDLHPFMRGTIVVN
jgi:plastocyanin